jgi:serine/threonine-protein kinase HipA
MLTRTAPLRHAVQDLQIVEKQIICLAENWTNVCDEASLSEVDRNLLWGNQFLNSFIFEGLISGNLQNLAKNVK